MHWLKRMIRDVRRPVTEARMYAVTWLPVLILVWALASYSLTATEHISMGAKGRELLAMAEQAKQDAHSLVWKVENDKPPKAYKIRYAQKKSQEMDELVKRIEDEEELLWGKYQRYKWPEYVPVYGTYRRITAEKSEYQKSLEANKKRLISTERKLEGDKLDRAIAEVEVNYIVQRMKDAVITEDDADFGNVLKRYRDEYVFKEYPTASIMEYVDKMLDEILTGWDKDKKPPEEEPEPKPPAPGGKLAYFLESDVPGFVPSGWRIDHQISGVVNKPDRSWVTWGAFCNDPHGPGMYSLLAGIQSFTTLDKAKANFNYEFNERVGLKMTSPDRAVASLQWQSEENWAHESRKVLRLYKNNVIYVEINFMSPQAETKLQALTKLTDEMEQKAIKLVDTALARSKP